MKKTTHFGYQEIPIADKTSKVRGVFNSVAYRYDLMNDLMSVGIHRFWKRVAVESIAIRPGMQILDLASGTGDLARAMIKRTGLNGFVVLADINHRMLSTGRDRFINSGHLKGFGWCQCDAELLPYPENHFDRVTISFGLRNVTEKGQALAEMNRVTKPNGKVLILEFSKPTSQSLTKFYDLYSFGMLPILGQIVTGDRESYQYLVESIRKHPDQETLKNLIEDAGFTNVTYTNLTGGIVAIHQGTKV